MSLKDIKIYLSLPKCESIQAKGVVALLLVAGLAVFGRVALILLKAAIAFALILVKVVLLVLGHIITSFIVPFAFVAGLVFLGYYFWKKR